MPGTVLSTKDAKQTFSFWWRYPQNKPISSSILWMETLWFRLVE